MEVSAQQGDSRTRDSRLLRGHKVPPPPYFHLPEQDLVSDGCRWTGSEGRKWRHLEAGVVDKDVNHPAGDDKKKKMNVDCWQRVEKLQSCSTCAHIQITARELSVR